MKFRALGKTGLDVSILSYGASSLGSVFRDINEAEGIKAVHTALDLGINYIDVSPYYGLTKAETVLGKAIKEVSRDQFILSTKAGRYGADEFDFSGKRIRQSLEESLQRLQTDYVDILLLHDIEFESLDVVLEQGIPALQKLKEEGKIRYYGVSGLPLDIFSMTLAQAKLDVILSYCHYALNDTSLLGLIPTLNQHEVGLISASPLSMGLLGDRGIPAWHPATDFIREVCQRAVSFCQEQGKDMTKLAIQYAVHNELIPTTLVSTASSDNIRRNIEWTEERLDEALLHEVLQILEPIHNHTWSSGRPEYNQNIIV
ncbi:aldo/keto reductase [Paenibacillus sp. WQ 127069]|uniref:Aldo/keto reductase n=1 Tax=Paenibacillus baimaensis TaxID=2982185 RepID=A0ABT2UU51_9BACL|nr:aldo/keto reductase [Paenibacillus sp. WQ 127069]MCU6798183.1 aldo/keto reductase [Paenibacillus sp. WQ 127069]